MDLLQSFLYASYRAEDHCRNDDVNAVIRNLRHVFRHPKSEALKAYIRIAAEIILKRLFKLIVNFDDAESSVVRIEFEIGTCVNVSRRFPVVSVALLTVSGSDF